MLQEEVLTATRMTKRSLEWSAYNLTSGGPRASSWDRWFPAY